MAKVRTLEECVLELDGIRKCAFCGKELSDGEVCTCNKYKLVLRNFGLIDKAQEQINHYQETINDLYGRMPEPNYDIREAIVSIPHSAEPSTEESTDGGGE